MAITLGKDCSVSVGGSLVGVRNVTIGYTVKTIEVNDAYSTLVESKPVAYDAFATIELNDPAGASGMISTLTNGSTVSVSGGAIGVSFTGVITAITESDPIDGVATVVIEARQARAGL